MITIIVAMDENRGIGYRGDLLTYLPGDLPRFKKITIGNTVIMGRKTFDSLPHGPLKDRTNIVITRNKGLKIDGVIIANSVDDAISKADPKKEIYIIGGGEIYSECINIADRLYITQIKKTYTADTFFPEISKEWIIEDSIAKNDDPALIFYYNTYRRL